MSLINVINFETLGDERGSLIALEENLNIPFKVKRVFYIFDTKQAVARGFHAHHNLEQLAVCVKGQCRFIVDNGQQRESVLLDSPSKGLYIKHKIWDEMHDFSDDCVLLVLASELYDEADYIRNYDDFLSIVNKDDS